MTNVEWASLKHFRSTENWGDSSKMSFELLSRMDAWASFLGRPIIVTCGTQGSHVGDSEHYDGLAADVIVPGLHVMDQWLSAVRFGFKALGMYPEWQYNNERLGGLHLGNRANSYMREWLGVQLNGSQTYIALNAENLKKYVL